MRVKPLGLSTRVKVMSHDWLLLNPPGISDTRRDLKINSRVITLDKRPRLILQLFMLSCTLLKTCKAPQIQPDLYLGYED